MTVRDFWEVLTFQVSWLDSNIFIVLLAIVVLILGIILFFGLLTEIYDEILEYTIFDREREYTDEELEKREKRAKWRVPKIIGFFGVLYLVWFILFG